MLPGILAADTNVGQVKHILKMFTRYLARPTAVVTLLVSGILTKVRWQQVLPTSVLAYPRLFHNAENKGKRPVYHS